MWLLDLLRRSAWMPWVCSTILRRHKIREIVELLSMPSSNRLYELAAVLSHFSGVIGLTQDAVDDHTAVDESLSAVGSDVYVGSVRDQRETPARVAGKIEHHRRGVHNPDLVLHIRRIAKRGRHILVRRIKVPAKHSAPLRRNRARQDYFERRERARLGGVSNLLRAIILKLQLK